MFNVLIADDDPFILDGLKYILDWQLLGLEIVGTVGNGKAAAEFIQKHLVDILLADIKMPEMDGIELIRWIRQNKYDIKCVILSGYDDYPYMKQAITLDIENYLIKSVNENELEETLKNIVEKLESRYAADNFSLNSIIKGNVLNRWVTGKISNREFQERSDLLNIDIKKNTFVVSVLRVNLEGKSNSGLYNIHDVDAFLQKGIRLQGTAVTPLFFQDMDGDFVFIFSDSRQEADPVKIRDYMLSVASVISSKDGLSHYIATGSPSDGYSAVSVSYKLAKMLLDYGIMHSAGYYLDMENAPEYFEFLSKVSGAADVDRFRNILLGGSYETSLEFISDTYLKDSTPPLSRQEHLINATLQLLFALLDTAAYHNLDISLLVRPSEAIYEKISSFTDHRELYLWVKALVTKYFGLLQDREDSQSPLIHRVITYVEANYYKDISLKVLSFEFNVNTAYLGRVFKTEKGEAFSNYLNRVRVEKAKELLLCKNYTINEVAGKVGYANPNYFISVFKKYAGIYPSQYRSRN